VRVTKAAACYFLMESLLFSLVETRKKKLHAKKNIYILINLFCNKTNTLHFLIHEKLINLMTTPHTQTS